MRGGTGTGEGLDAGPRSADPAPLRGLRVLVTAGGDLGERLVAGVQARGGTAVRSPLVRTEPVDGDALAAAVSRWNSGAYDWMLLTSAAGARAVAQVGARPAAQRIAAVGPGTAAACAEAGLPVDLVPERDYSARGLATALLETLTGPSRVLLPVSEIASGEVEAALAAAGHRIDRVTAYRTLPAPRNPWVERAVAAGGVEAILVSSGSAAREAASRFGALPDGTAIIAIGAPTAEALASAGLHPTAVAVEHTAEGLLDALVRVVGGSEAEPGGSPPGSAAAPRAEPPADPSPRHPRNPHPEGPLA